MAANHENGELVEFVNELARRAQFPSDAAWARAAEYPSSNLSDLRAGKAGVSGANLVRLIKAAAARTHQDGVDLAFATYSELEEALARLEAVAQRLRAHQGSPPNAQGHGQV